MPPFRFGVSAATPMLTPTSDGWATLARRAEDLGYSTLLTADHLGFASTLAPLVAAAGVTERLRFGSLVLNNDFHHPLRLAQEAATVDALTGGRLELGLGSGWNKPEYDLLGLSYDPPAERAARLGDAIRTMKRAWTGDAALTLASGERTRPAVPPPAQSPHPPILIGGHGDAILRVAAAEADIVQFTGVTWRGDRLVPSGMDVDVIAERVAFVREAAGERAGRLELSVLVQRIHIGDDAGDVRDGVAAEIGVDPSVVEASPFVLVGSEGSVIDKLTSLRERLGISYFALFEPGMEALAPVIAALS